MHSHLPNQQGSSSSRLLTEIIRTLRPLGSDTNLTVKQLLMRFTLTHSCVLPSKRSFSIKRNKRTLILIINIFDKCQRAEQLYYTMQRANIILRHIRPFSNLYRYVSVRYRFRLVSDLFTQTTC